MDLKVLYKQKCEIINKIKEMKNEILELNYEDFSYHISFLTPQSSGCIIEKYIIKKLNGTKVSAKMDKGDVEINGEFFEIKSSTINDTNRHINLVQLRPWQKINGYIINVIDMDNGMFNGFHTLKLSKEQMLEECSTLNATAAHGIKEVADGNALTELRLSVKYNSDTYNEWVEKYKIDV